MIIFCMWFVPVHVTLATTNILVKLEQHLANYAMVSNTEQRVHTESGMILFQGHFELLNLTLYLFGHSYTHAT